jgi:LmbE family N-acetylglucosaminyl deacetylase
MHLFLTPHGDDVVLSCGGQIAQLAKRGEKIVIFNVMGGDPPIEYQPTQASRNEPLVAARREETIAAGKALGADVKFGPYPEAVYRVATSGGAFYPTDATLYSTVHPNDPAKQAKRAAVLQTIMALFSIGAMDVIHIPLGLSQHVDHQLVRDMGLSLSQWRPDNIIVFYEDYSHSLPSESMVQTALTGLGGQSVVTIHPIDSASVETKMSAINCFKSRQGSAWDSPETMGRAIRTYMRTIGGEREWRFLPDAA